MSFDDASPSDVEIVDEDELIVGRATGLKPEEREELCLARAVVEANMDLREAGRRVLGGTNLKLQWVQAILAAPELSQFREHRDVVLWFYMQGDGARRDDEALGPTVSCPPPEWVVPNRQ